MLRQPLFVDWEFDSLQSKECKYFLSNSCSISTPIELIWQAQETISVSFQEWQGFLVTD